MSRFWAGREEASASESESDSGSDSSGAAKKTQKEKRQWALDSDSESEDEVRVVKSAKDRSVQRACESSLDLYCTRHAFIIWLLV